jgi:hypothetical protein
MHAEYWAHEYANKPPGEEFEDEDFDLQQVLKDMETEDDPGDWGEPI